MKQSILLQRIATLDASRIKAEEAVEMATRWGARYLNIDAGVLAPGRLADVVVIDLSGSHVQPVHKAVTSIAYSANSSDVHITIVGGEVIYEDGRCLRVDEEEVIREASARAAELLARAGMVKLRSAWETVSGV